MRSDDQDTAHGQLRQIGHAGYVRSRLSQGNADGTVPALEHCNLHTIRQSQRPAREDGQGLRVGELHHPVGLDGQFECRLGTTVGRRHFQFDREGEVIGRFCIKGVAAGTDCLRANDEAPEQRQVRRPRGVVVDIDGSPHGFTREEPAVGLADVRAVCRVRAFHGQVTGILCRGELPGFGQNPRAQAGDVGGAVGLDLHGPGGGLAARHGVVQVAIGRVTQQGGVRVGLVVVLKVQKLSEIQRLLSVPLPERSRPPADLFACRQPPGRVWPQVLPVEFHRVVEVHDVRHALGVGVPVVHDWPRRIEALHEAPGFGQAVFTVLGVSLSATMQNLVLQAGHHDGGVILVHLDHRPQMGVEVLPENRTRESVVPRVTEERGFHDHEHALFVGGLKPGAWPDVGVQAHCHAPRLSQTTVVSRGDGFLQARLFAARRMTGRAQEPGWHTVEQQLLALDPELAETETRARLVHCLAVLGQGRAKVVEVRIFGTPQPWLGPRSGEA